MLGPSVFGRIPGFTATIFPPISLPALSAVANLGETPTRAASADFEFGMWSNLAAGHSLVSFDPGLCFYLFLVGLELDPAVLKRNASRALATSIAGMVVPFALGAASSWALYEKFMDVPGATNVPPFGSFLLFLGGENRTSGRECDCRFCFGWQARLLVNGTSNILTDCYSHFPSSTAHDLLRLAIARLAAASSLLAQSPCQSPPSPSSPAS